MEINKPNDKRFNFIYYTHYYNYRRSKKRKLKRIYIINGQVNGKMKNCYVSLNYI